MSRVNTIHGFGDVKFVQIRNGTTFVAEFLYGYGKVIYKPLKIDRTTRSRKIVPKYFGWRAVVKLDIGNYITEHSAETVKLIVMLNDIVNNGNSILIYPRYSGSATYTNLEIESNLIESDFNIDDLGNIEAGQKYELEFTKPEVVNYIPTIVKIANLFNLTFNTSQANFNNNNAVVRIN